MTSELLHCLIAGGTGAIIKEIVIDNSLTLPNLKDGKFFLGFLGSALIGAFVGTVIDGSFVTSMMAGFTGLAAIENLILKKTPNEPIKECSIETMIKSIAIQEGVDQVLALRVAQAESGLNSKAINTNTDGSKDRGLYQINDK
jgi:xanthine/uracil/vitamin C permease (AzgA family)